MRKLKNVTSNNVQVPYCIYFILTNNNIKQSKIYIPLRYEKNGFSEYGIGVEMIATKYILWGLTLQKDSQNNMNINLIISCIN